jgi:hypothetical protein
LPFWVKEQAASIWVQNTLRIQQPDNKRFRKKSLAILKTP